LGSTWKLAAIAMMAQLANADLECKVFLILMAFAVWFQGVSFRNETNWVGIDNVSLMGGVPLIMKVNGGIDMNAAANTIGVLSKNIPQAQFILPRMSGKCVDVNLILLDDDAFNSNPPAGKLAWTIPPAAEIFSTPTKKYSYFDFNNLPGGLPGAYPSPNGGIDYLTFDITITSLEYSPPCVTSFGRCHITYNQRFTP
jgi:hypothetical protein